MHVLIVGSGGREHALAWKIAQSQRVERVFVAPGNAGTAEDAENVDIQAGDFPRLIKFAQQNDVGLTVVGPEGPLTAGIVDAFSAAKLRAFGPTRMAAELEASKVFCKNLLRHADVPTADYRVFRSAERAVTFLKDREDVPVVVKADGLAAGKGVFVCASRAEALEAVDRIARAKEFGDAGNQLVIEERLDGQEASVLAITDGQTIVTLPPVQDHKRAFDGDTGPNTGGMGAYSPTPLLDEAALGWIEAHVLVPTVHAMKRARRPFRGVLYAG
ncbi:MAG: phosphoribosylamine--glycine ligase, partial [Pirellulales bacterium]